MPVADSENPAHQRAFKTGYRYGLAGKSFSHMPHDIRQNGELREYFAQGMEASQEDLAAQQELLSKPNWRYRLTWIAVMIIGGIATAGVMLQQIAEERQQSILKMRSSESDSTANTALMSDAQREDMLYRQQQFSMIEQRKTPLRALTDNPNLRLEKASLRSQGETFSLSTRQATGESTTSLPKYLRTLEFSAQLQLNKPQQIWLHWRYDGLIINRRHYQLDTGKHLIQSVQKMSSSRQGRWYLEFVDAQQQVFARMTFNYGTLNENH